MQHTNLIARPTMILIARRMAGQSRIKVAGAGPRRLAACTNKHRMARVAATPREMGTSLARARWVDSADQ